MDTLTSSRDLVALTRVFLPRLLSAWRAFTKQWGRELGEKAGKRSECSSELLERITGIGSV
jgi:hypothetical protein